MTRADPICALLCALVSHHEASGEEARQRGSDTLAALHWRAMDSLTDALGLMGEIDAVPPIAREPEREAL